MKYRSSTNHNWVDSQNLCKMHLQQVLQSFFVSLHSVITAHRHNAHSIFCTVGPCGHTNHTLRCSISLKKHQLWHLGKETLWIIAFAGWRLHIPQLYYFSVVWKYTCIFFPIKNNGLSSKILQPHAWPSYTCSQNASCASSVPGTEGNCSEVVVSASSLC